MVRRGTLAFDAYSVEHHPVGVSLLTKTDVQPPHLLWMYGPLREQAHSHRGSAMCSICADYFPPLPATLSPPRVR